MFYSTEGNVVESDVDERDDNESILVRGTDVDISILDTEDNFEVQPKKKKTKNTSTFEEKLLTVLANRRVEDPVTSFLMSLAPQIRSLTQDQQNEVYIEFINSIKKVKNSNNAHQSQAPYIPPPAVNNNYPRSSDHCFLTNDSLYSYPQYPPYHGIPSTSTIPTSAVQTNVGHSANLPYYSQLNYAPPTTSTSTSTPTPSCSNNNY